MTNKKLSVTIILFMCGSLAVGFLLYSTSKVVYRDHKIEKEIEQLKADSERIKNDNRVLQDRIAYFETSEFQERVAKEKLNMQKPDEGVVVIKQSRDGEQQEEVQENVLPQQENNRPTYLKWWDYFFSYN